MLVMVRRSNSFVQRLFKKSFTKALSYVTKFPLLIVPENYAADCGQATYTTISHEHRPHSFSAKMPG
jgi:hypothetical protein